MNEFKLYAVTGNPIMFSQSPQIYNTLFDHTNMNARYIRILASSTHESLNIGKELNLGGLNLTSPFKQEAVQFVHKISPQAEKIKAVNLILFSNSHLSGFNTDSYGVIKALNTNGISVQGKNCVILGAGGAGRAAVYGLKKSKAARVTLVNRTKSKAKKAAHYLGCEYAPLERLEDMIRDCDIFISCVPDFQSCLDYQQLPYDLNFLNASYKHFFSEIREKQKTGRYISGLDWLSFQAFLSFRLMTGIKISEKTKKTIGKKLRNKKETYKSNIALIGFMGSGKTSVGRCVADLMGSNFVDSDKHIEKSEGFSINDVFKKIGEKKFREVEKSSIIKLLQHSRNTVFSMGGGAVLHSKIIKELRKSCHVIWLWSPLEETLQRTNFQSRPLLFNSSPRKVKQLLISRIPYYAKASDLVVSSPTGEIKETAQRIKNEIDKTIHN